MFWLTRPPYVRWGVATLLVLLSLWVELRPTTTVEHPFLTRDVAIGQPLDGALEIREVAAGVVHPVEPIGYVSRPLRAGEPLLPGDLNLEPRLAPPGWWMLELDLPEDAVEGSPVLLVATPEPGTPAMEPLSGLVVVISHENDTFGAGRTKGSVAFPPDQAAAAAVAIAEGRATVLIQYPE